MRRSLSPPDPSLPPPRRCQLQGLFSQFGTILDVHLMHPSQKTLQRCAFVTFESSVSAQAATKIGGVHKMDPNDKPIVVRFADQPGQGGGKRPRM